MARKVFISFLGSSPYGECAYGYGNFVSSKTRFVQQATLEWLQYKEVAPDHHVILLTKGDKGSRKNNWEKVIYERYNSRNNQLEACEPYKGLSGVFEDSKLLNITDLNIPDGKDETEIFEIFEILANEIDEGDELYLDLTHGFRYLPMLLLVMSNYLKTNKKVTIAHISYGNYESRISDVAPFVDLLPLLKIQENIKGKDIEQVKEIYKQNIESNKIKILLIGSFSSQNPKQELLQVFPKQYEYDIVLKTDYEKLTNENFLKKIDMDYYNFIIAGPIPHSCKGKDISTGLDTYCKINGLKAKVFKNHQTELSQSQLKMYAKEITNVLNKA
jgi:CRISPR-associated Csx2 family protein